MQVRRSTSPGSPIRWRAECPGLNKRWPAALRASRSMSWRGLPLSTRLSDMTDILDRIIAVKHQEFEAGRREKSLEALRAEALAAPPPRDFAGALLRTVAAGR